MHQSPHRKLWSKESKKENMFQNKDNTISTKHYMYTTQEKYVFGELLILQKSLNLVFETFIFSSMFSTIHHIFHWVMFNNPVIMLNTEVAIAYC